MTIRQGRRLKALNHEAFAFVESRMVVGAVFSLVKSCFFLPLLWGRKKTTQTKYKPSLCLRVLERSRPQNNSYFGVTSATERLTEKYLRTERRMTMGRMRRTALLGKSREEEEAEEENERRWTTHILRAGNKGSIKAALGRQSKEEADGLSSALPWACMSLCHLLLLLSFFILCCHLSTVHVPLSLHLSVCVSKSWGKNSPAALVITFLHPCSLLSLSRRKKRIEFTLPCPLLPHPPFYRSRFLPLLKMVLVSYSDPWQVHFCALTPSYVHSLPSFFLSFLHCHFSTRILSLLWLTDSPRGLDTVLLRCITQHRTSSCCHTYIHPYSNLIQTGFQFHWGLPDNPDIGFKRNYSETSLDLSWTLSHKWELHTVGGFFLNEQTLSCQITFTVIAENRLHSV